MITEDYVSFETAELLKEKGFPQDPRICNTAYTLKGSLSNNAKSFIYDYVELNKLGIKPNYYSIAPTLQMAMKWLREEKNIILDICPNLDLDCMCIGTYCRIVYKDNERVTLDADYDDFATYEEAVEAAIKYCLENLI